MGKKQISVSYSDVSEGEVDWLVSVVLVVLGRVAEITVDIMVLIVSFDVLKKSGFSRILHHRVAHENHSS